MDPNGSIIITEKKEVKLLSINIGMYYDSCGFPVLNLEEGGSINFDDPVHEMCATLEKQSGNYLRFPESYISVARVRPWGVGIHEGDVTKRAIRVNEIKDLFRTSWPALKQSDVEYNHPVMGGYNIRFFRKRRFQRNFSEEFSLPIFSFKSLDEYYQAGEIKSKLKGELRTYMKMLFSNKKIKILNEGYTLTQDNVRDYKIENVNPAYVDSHAVNQLKHVEMDCSGIKV